MCSPFELAATATGMPILRRFSTPRMFSIDTIFASQAVHSFCFAIEPLSTDRLLSRYQTAANSLINDFNIAVTTYLAAGK
jgi:hypothetical protein